MILSTLTKPVVTVTGWNIRCCLCRERGSDCYSRWCCCLAPILQLLQPPHSQALMSSKQQAASSTTAPNHTLTTNFGADPLAATLSDQHLYPYPANAKTVPVSYHHLGHWVADSWQIYNEFSTNVFPLAAMLTIRMSQSQGSIC